jgi:hypothetical protein
MISALGAYMGVSEEATFGTASGTLDNHLRVESDFEGLELDRGLLKANTLEGVVDDVFADAKGRLSVAGPIEFPMQFGGGWMAFLCHTIGKAATTTGAGPYAHEVDLGALPDITARGLTVAVGRSGYSPAGGTQLFAYRGIRPTAFEIRIGENDLVRAGVEVFGQNLAYAAHAAPAADGSDYSSENWIKTPSDAGTPTALFTWGGTSYIIRSLTFRVEQAWVRRFDPIDDEMLVPGLSEKRTITVEAEVEALDTASSSGGAFMDDYKQRNARACVITIDGGTPANESLAISLAGCRIMAPPDPHASVGDIMRSTLRIQAAKNGATSAGTVTLTNSETAAYT